MYIAKACCKQRVPVEFCHLIPRSVLLQVHTMAIDELQRHIYNQFWLYREGSRNLSAQRLQVLASKSSTLSDLALMH
jgi:hypothetical protein